ncbi:uncharacterized protein BP5553_06443 [Venustampulla echinocandica]|uniref:Uncharacterized protein n=1 Tax=Venustampulla echinocandica TaxID=2656787 RepID=A0A370TJX6_9HELO|nr:uncharacterized protein BP5553_06443 [Venustampulla echinocandica]RDL35831.1 hypothetical protein BP5553_06443 [Venustampulla echinocandica]
MYHKKSLVSFFPILIHLARFILYTSATTSPAQWELISLASRKNANSTSSLEFNIKQDDYTTSCSTVTWTPTGYPRAWNKCHNEMLSSTPPSITITRTPLSLNSADTYAYPNFHCESTADYGLECLLLSSSTAIDLKPSISQFIPAPLKIYYTLIRSSGSTGVQGACISAYTFYILNPSVATLGPLTLGHAADRQWRTQCTTSWDCDGTDPSTEGTWASCAAPAFQFKKSLAYGGNQLTDFVLSVEHSFPLIMASSIRGDSTPDLKFQNPDEAEGLQVILKGNDTLWKNGTSLISLQSGGIDQTGDCDTGCSFNGVVANVDVVQVEIV